MKPRGPLRKRTGEKLNSITDCDDDGTKIEYSYQKTSCTHGISGSEESRGWVCPWRRTTVLSVSIEALIEKYLVLRGPTGTYAGGKEIFILLEPASFLLSLGNIFYDCNYNDFKWWSEMGNGKSWETRQLIIHKSRSHGPEPPDDWCKMVYLQKRVCFTNRIKKKDGNECSAIWAALKCTRCRPPQKTEKFFFSKSGVKSSARKSLAQNEPIRNSWTFCLCTLLFLVSRFLRTSWLEDNLYVRFPHHHNVADNYFTITCHPLASV